MNGWEIMLRGWHNNYYIEPFMFICEVAAIIFGIIFHRKNKIGKFFICYAAIDTTMLILIIYLDYFSTITNLEFNISINIINSISYTCELVVYFFFFSQTLQNELSKKIMSVLTIIFISLALLNILNVIFFNIIIIGKGDTNYLGTIEFLFLIVPCLFYFTELFTKPSAKSLFQRPSFWITTGVFFYTFVSIPFYFIMQYLHTSKYQFNNELIALFFAVPYGLSFLFLSKAFLCKTELTT